jgi:hypothetical protein
VRRGAAETLSRIGSQAVVASAALQKAENDDDKRVRQFAHRALENMHR